MGGIRGPRGEGRVEAIIPETFVVHGELTEPESVILLVVQLVPWWDH
jgi:hypothetical protein